MKDWEEKNNGRGISVRNHEEENDNIHFQTYIDRERMQPEGNLVLEVEEQENYAQSIESSPLMRDEPTHSHPHQTMFYSSQAWNVESPGASQRKESVVMQWMRAVKSSESLQRSFCFAAIDGLLTGAGITGASSGLGLLDAFYSHSLSLTSVVICLCLAACSADALCMSIGHVWSTYILSEHALEDRTREELALRCNPSESKARLVDLLLLNGMLKIDAMSLADTLEGYPDIFLAFLTSNCLTVNSRPSYAVASDSDSANSPLQNIPDHLRQHPCSCSLLGCSNDLDNDPILKDSWNEAGAMMLSFSLFSIFPSLVYSFFDQGTLQNTLFYAIPNEFTDRQEQIGVNPLTATILINSILMFLFGVWKSKFFSSSWVLFGIETVLVLLLCIMSSYGLGVFFRIVLL